MVNIFAIMDSSLGSNHKHQRTERQTQQSSSRRSLSEITLLLRYCVRRTPANRDAAPLPSQPSLPVTIATPSRLQSKLVVGGRCKSFVHLFPPLHPLPSFSITLFLFLPSIHFPRLSAGNRCPASPHKYLLITFAGDS